jgi:hypothetical protein
MTFCFDCHNRDNFILNMLGLQSLILKLLSSAISKEFNFSH